MKVPDSCVVIVIVILILRDGVNLKSPFPSRVHEVEEDDRTMVRRKALEWYKRRVVQGHESAKVLRATDQNEVSDFLEELDVSKRSTSTFFGRLIVTDERYKRRWSFYLMHVPSGSSIYRNCLNDSSSFGNRCDHRFLPHFEPAFLL